MAFNTNLAHLRDHLRLLLGDVSTSDASVDFPDVTYDAKLAATGYVQAGIEMALALIALYGRKLTDSKDGDASIAYRDRLDALKQVLNDLRAGNIQEPGKNRSGIAISTMKAGSDFKEPGSGCRF